MYAIGWLYKKNTKKMKIKMILSQLMTNFHVSSFFLLSSEFASAITRIFKQHSMSHLWKVNLFGWRCLFCMLLCICFIFYFFQLLAPIYEQQQKMLSKFYYKLKIVWTCITRPFAHVFYYTIHPMLCIMKMKLWSQAIHTQTHTTTIVVVVFFYFLTIFLSSF